MKNSLDILSTADSSCRYSALNMHVAHIFGVFYRNASLYSGCVNAIDCAGVKHNRLILDVRTAKRHAELHQNVCANAVREGPSLLTHSAAAP